MNGATESTSLVRYDAMCNAIAECERVDEVKQIRDKARALEIYAQQLKNTDAERKAANVRLRAERRYGELLSELKRAESGAARNPFGRGGKKANHEPMLHDVTQVNSAPEHEPERSEYADALARTDVNRVQARRYQQLAAVPEEVFEQALADPTKRPTSAGIVRSVSSQPTPTMDPSVLRIWGVARDFERHADARLQPRAVFAAMTETMQSDMLRLVPQLADFWTFFQQEIDV
jgi:hypothetical protein